MKRIASYLCAAVALMMSCSVQEENVEVSRQDGMVFHASFEQPSGDTRVYANEDLLLRWTADDRVSIFNKNTYNQQYVFTGETGANAGDFRKVDAGESLSDSGIPHYVSVYPFQESTTISEFETITVTLPAEQHYVENTFGLGDNTMVSVSEDNVLLYKNVCGYLRLNLYGEGVSVSSIMLKGKDGEKLAGQATVTMPLDGIPSAVLSDEATAEISLVCETPVELGATAEESKAFWFVVPQVTFNEGFVVSVTEANGGVFEQSSSKCISITRSNVSTMAPVEVKPMDPPVAIPEAIDLGLSVKWASFNVGATKPEEYGDYFAWGEVEPDYEPGYARSENPVWKPGKESGYSWASYKWCNGSETSLTKYNTNPSNGTVDNIMTLDPEDDAAHVILGDSWRMPTKAEIQELVNNCTSVWTTENGVYGRRFTSTKSGYTDKSVFLPASGFRNHEELSHLELCGSYWSSSLGGSDRASVVGFRSDQAYYYDDVRLLGFTIRPVYIDYIEVEGVSLNRTSLTLTEGNVEALTAVIEPSNASVKAVEWSSSNTAVATVSSTGEVTAVSAGTATITVTTQEGSFKAECAVIVKEPTAPIPEAIDLGLSVKWASFNLGATKPEESGDYYAWGEIETKEEYNWSTYRWCEGSENTLTKYNSNNTCGILDYNNDLDHEDDVAHVKLGGNWRLPSLAEIRELVTHSTSEWIEVNGVYGCRVTSSVDGYTDKSIFLPAAGYAENRSITRAGTYGTYASLSLHNGPFAANFLIGSGRCEENIIRRYAGLTIRAVRE